MDQGPGIPRFWPRTFCLYTVVSRLGFQWSAHCDSRVLRSVRVTHPLRKLTVSGRRSGDGVELSTAWARIDTALALLLPFCHRVTDEIS